MLLWEDGKLYQTGHFPAFHVEPGSGSKPLQGGMSAVKSSNEELQRQRQDLVEKHPQAVGIELRCRIIHKQRCCL